MAQSNVSLSTFLVSLGAVPSDPTREEMNTILLRERLESLATETVGSEEGERDISEPSIPKGFSEQ